MNPIILEDVTRSFDGRRVLDGLTARAEEGRVIGLLGRNGEGKTTLFKVLLGLLAPDSGRVEVLAGLVAELGESGRTVLVASHRLDELAGLLDEVWVLAGGRIAAVHDAARLRAEARRVTGRPRPGFAAPAGVLSLAAESPLGAWAALDSASTARLLASGLEAADAEPLPLAESLKALLALHGGLR